MDVVAHFGCLFRRLEIADGESVSSRVAHQNQLLALC